MKNSKKRKSNQTASRIRTRSNTRDTDDFINVHNKENNSNHGFTQLIQTKMMEAKKRQGNRKNKKTNATKENNQSPTVSRKRQRSDNEESPITTTEIEVVERNDRPTNTADEQGTTVTITSNPRCELKDHHLVPANKRRRACLCSKRQLDELEFARDSIHSQTPQEQPPQEESHLEPVITLINRSPPPLLLPKSPLIPPSTLSFARPSISSISIIQHEQTREEEEQEKNQSYVPSMMAAPLSPAMPLNSTYIAHRSIPIVTQMPSTLLGLSTLMPTNTTTTNESSSRITSSIIQKSNLDQQISDHPAVLVPVESLSNQQDQATSMTPPTADQIIQCSVSTQTIDDYSPIHSHCNDVSVCPCVQIYTRSEQLFMASMAIFFRNSITVAPQESPLTTIRKNNKRQQIDHSETPSPTNVKSVAIDSEKHNETIPPPALIDTSTMINETYVENSKKSDGSSIQININSGNECNQKFKSLVLTMTALKDEQKIIFNRFIEHFSVRSSASIDDSTTHLITDEDDKHSLICPLTGKVLQAVARHLTIVSCRWLTACLTEQRYVDEIPTYEIIGDAIYNQHNGMSRSRMNHSQNHRLLANYAFHLKCHGCQPFIDNRPLIELIHLSGGLILKTLNQHIDNIGRQIIILCSKNYLQNKPALEQACQKLNILCIEPEWLIASIVKFDIQPFAPWLCTLFS